jgi:large subunit ribosomal protein L30e
MTAEAEIKEAIKARKTLIGTRSVMKAFMTGHLKSVIYARNTPPRTLSDIRHYANITGSATQEFTGSSAELGELCGKPFSILLLGIKK